MSVYRCFRRVLNDKLPIGPNMQEAVRETEGELVP
jgi:hypothetical protein